MSRHRQRSATVKRLGEAVKALALCHNVTPVHEFPENGELGVQFFCYEPFTATGNMADNELVNIVRGGSSA